MIYKIFADFLVFLHLLWIIFMIGGFFLIVIGFFRGDFLDRWIFRTLHLLGIIYIGILAVLREYCPLTIWENTLRNMHEAGTGYPGSFIGHYIQKIVYPNVNPDILRFTTALMGILTVIFFILRPPQRIKEFFSGGNNG